MNLAALDRSFFSGAMCLTLVCPWTSTCKNILWYYWFFTLPMMSWVTCALMDQTHQLISVIPTSSVKSSGLNLRSCTSLEKVGNKQECGSVQPIQLTRQKWWQTNDPKVVSMVGMRNCWERDPSSTSIKRNQQTVSLFNVLNEPNISCYHVN